MPRRSSHFRKAGTRSTGPEECPLGSGAHARGHATMNYMRTFAVSLAFLSVVSLGASAQERVAADGERDFLRSGALLETVRENIARGLTIHYSRDKEAVAKARQRVQDAKTCREVGLRKLESQAASFGIKINIGTARLTDTSSNALAAYYWWSADVTDIAGRVDLYPAGTKPVLTVLTQHPTFQACF